MKTQTTGTLIDGTVQLDEPVELPNHTRVNVRLEPIPNYDLAQAEAAIESFKKLTEEHPIHSGGRHYTRDELYERH